MSTDTNQRVEKAGIVHSNRANQCNVDHSQAIASIVRTQLRLPSLTKSLILGSAVNEAVKELEAKINIIRGELAAIQAEHAILEDPANLAHWCAR